jgi:hypothetical protein
VKKTNKQTKLKKAKSKKQKTKNKNQRGGKSYKQRVSG